MSRILARLGREGLLLDRFAGDDGRATDQVDRLPIVRVVTDSREAAPGTLFCAVRGVAGDGHRFLPQVVASGAAAALVEQLQPGLALPQFAVRSGRRAAAFAAAEWADDPWSELVAIGVTGTNGKTTTVGLLRHLLTTGGLPCASIGTLGIIGADGEPVPGSEGLTTPGPTEVAERFAELGESGARAVAIEASSHALDQERVAAVRFDAGIWTNLSRDHLDYHGTAEAYRSAKLRLAALLKPGAAAVANADDPAWDELPAHASRVVRFALGADATAEIRATDIRTVPEGTEWRLQTPDGSAAVAMPLWGRYNVANAAGAAAALWSLGWNAERIAVGLADVPQVPGRLERVPGPTGAPAVLLDYAHTPDALARALAAVRPLARGRVLVVFGAGGDRDRGKRPEMGRVAAMGADLSIVTSDNPRSEDPERILRDIESGMGHAPRLRVLDRREAILAALHHATPDDIVLLAGKGHERYQIWGTEVRPFDEHAIARELLDEWAAGVGARDATSPDAASRGAAPV